MLLSDAEALASQSTCLWPFRTDLGSGAKRFRKTNVWSDGTTMVGVAPSSTDRASRPRSRSPSPTSPPTTTSSSTGAARSSSSTAPVIKLPAGASEDDHLALLGLLNSSTACFWLKQVCHHQGRRRHRAAGIGSARTVGGALRPRRHQGQPVPPRRTLPHRPRPPPGHPRPGPLRLPPRRPLRPGDPHPRRPGRRPGAGAGPPPADDRPAGGAGLALLSALRAPAGHGG